VTRLFPFSGINKRERAYDGENEATTLTFGHKEGYFCFVLVFVEDEAFIAFSLSSFFDVFRLLYRITLKKFADVATLQIGVIGQFVNQGIGEENLSTKISQQDAHWQRYEGFVFSLFKHKIFSFGYNGYRAFLTKE